MDNAHMKFPFGKKGMLAAGLVAAGVVYWRVQEQRRQAALAEWEAETDEAIAQSGDPLDETFEIPASSVGE